jgi:histone H3/H4
MPGLEQYLRNIPNGSDDMDMSTPELIPLHLPSSLPSDKRGSVCVPDLPEVEDRLRFAQACEALMDLRCQLTKRTYASRYRTANISSQTHFTRFRDLQEQTDLKIKSASSRYRLARSGLVQLRGKGDWEKKLQELRPEDIRGLSEKALVNEEKEQRKTIDEMAGITSAYPIVDEILNQRLPPTLFNPHLAVGEGNRTLSWIWYSTSNDEILGDTTTRIGTCKFLFLIYYQSISTLINFIQTFVWSG